MTSTNYDVFYRRYNVCCNEHRFADLPEFVDPEVIVNGTAHGLDAYAEGLRSVVQAFPDYRWELQHLVVDGTWIAAHLTDSGTHRGTFFDVSATARTVSIEEFAFYRVAAGKIVEVWGMAFHLQLLDQLR